MTPKPSVLAAASLAWRQVLARPHVVVSFLVLNLLAAWVLAAPLKGLLSDTLDRSQYGEVMASDSSWRWFDTVDRGQPHAFGNLDAWNALFSDKGLRFKDLKALAGPPAAIALAGLLLFWANALLHCGFLATLYPDARGPGLGIGAAASRFGATTARFTPPASTLAFFALLVYGLIYALFYVQTGKWLEGTTQSTDREWVALGWMWLRLGLTLLALLGAKLLFDLAKVVLVDRGTWNWPWAFLLALRELGSRGWRYLALYLLIGAGAPALTALWIWTGGRLVAGGWFSLLLLFLLQQLLLGARIALRLAHLAATRALYLEARSLHQAEKPPFKIEVGDDVVGI